MNDKNRKNEVEAAAARWLRDVCRAACDHPDDMHVDSFSTPHRIVLSPCCNPADAGRLIGRGGETFRALKRAAHYYRRQQDVQPELEVSTIKSPRSGGPPSQARYDSSWPIGLWHQAVDQFAEAMLGQCGAVDAGHSPVMVTYSTVAPLTPDEVRDVSNCLNTVGKAVAKAMGGEVFVDVVRKNC